MLWISKNRATCIVWASALLLILGFLWIRWLLTFWLWRFFALFKSYYLWFGRIAFFFLIVRDDGQVATFSVLTGVWRKSFAKIRVFFVNLVRWILFWCVQYVIWNHNLLTASSAYLRTSVRRVMLFSERILLVLSRDHGFVHIDPVLALSWFSRWLFTLSSVLFDFLLRLKLLLCLLDQLMVSLVKGFLIIKPCLF